MKSKFVPGVDVNSAPAEARLRASPFLRMPFLENPCNTAFWPVEKEAAARSGTSRNRDSESADRSIGLTLVSVSSLAISISSSSASADILANLSPDDMRIAVNTRYHFLILSCNVGQLCAMLGCHVMQREVRLCTWIILIESAVCYTIRRWMKHHASVVLTFICTLHLLENEDAPEKQ